MEHKNALRAPCSVHEPMTFNDFLYCLSLVSQGFLKKKEETNKRLERRAPANNLHTADLCMLRRSTEFKKKNLRFF